jgi:hypothetical protein
LRQFQNLLLIGTAMYPAEPSESKTDSQLRLWDLELRCVADWGPARIVEWHGNCCALLHEKEYQNGKQYSASPFVAGDWIGYP